MNWILVKLLYLWLAFFLFHLCYVSQTKKNTGFLKVNLTCSYSWVSTRRPPSLRLLIVWYFSTQDILISIPLPINYSITFPTHENVSNFWNNIFMLTYLQSHKRNGPSLLRTSCKEANTFCFVLQVSIKKPTYCLLLTSFRIK